MRIYADCVIIEFVFYELVRRTLITVSVTLPTHSSLQYRNPVNYVPIIQHVKCTSFQQTRCVNIIIVFGVANDYC